MLNRMVVKFDVEAHYWVKVIDVNDRKWNELEQYKTVKRRLEELPKSVINKVFASMYNKDKAMLVIYYNKDYEQKVLKEVLTPWYMF